MLTVSCCLSRVLSPAGKDYGKEGGSEGGGAREGLLHGWHFNMINHRLRHYRTALTRQDVLPHPQHARAPARTCGGVIGVPVIPKRMIHVLFSAVQ